MLTVVVSWYQTKKLHLAFWSTDCRIKSHGSNYVRGITARNNV